jgi:hypothetical protein
MRIAYFLLLAALFSYSSLSAQSETTYDVEYQCICLVDSIAPGNVVQFWRFTQANNPGALALDYEYDLSATYTVAGTVMGCNDYYLGDNVNTGGGTAGTLPIWTSTYTLGNSSLTEGSGVLSSSLTGALKLPAGTDAQDPVWSAGMLRYNTTSNGIQGYDGTAERFLPWADADNWANQRIPFSNGSQLTTSADLYFDDATNRLFINAPTSTSQYAININNAGSGSGINISNTNTAIRINASFPAISIGTGLITFDNNASNGISASTNNNTYWMDINTTGSSGVPARFRGNRPVSFKNQASTGNNACIETNHTKNLNAEFENIRISDDENWSAGNAYANGGTTIGAGLGIYWWYNRKENAAGYRYNACTITPIIQNADSLAMDIGLKTALHINNTLTTVSVLDSAGMLLPLYAAGTLTGTPATSAAFNSSGRLIQVPEKWKTISTTTDASGDVTVTHGMGTTPTSVQVTTTGTANYNTTVHTIGATTFKVRFFDQVEAYAEMYIDDTDPDTISFLAGSTTPAEGTDWTSGDLAGWTYSAGRLTYTGTETARFAINTSISFSFAESNVQIESWIYRNNSEVIGAEFHRQIGTGGDIGNAGHSCIVEMNTNDYIEIFFAPEAHTGDNNLIIQNANVSVQKISGGTIKSQAVTATWHAKT